MDTTSTTGSEGPLLAVAEHLLEIVDELGWDQPARVALLTSGSTPALGQVDCPIAGDHGLSVGWPTTIEGHPCPALAALGAQPDAAAAVLVTEGWADAESILALGGSNDGCVEHISVDGRLEIRTAVAVHRDGTRVQVTRPRGGVAHTACQIGGRVPDALAMTVGIDADLSGVRVDDILRRAWLSIAAIDVAGRLGPTVARAANANDVFDRFRESVAETRFSELGDDIAASPFARLARVVARSVSDDPDVTWKRAATRLCTESSEEVPMIGWALASAVEPFLLERWNATSERHARRWAGPGMLASITEAGYPSWDDLDVLFGEAVPRTRTYLELLPAIDEITADLAGNTRPT